MQLFSLILYISIKTRLYNDLQSKYLPSVVVELPTRVSCLAADYPLCSCLGFNLAAITNIFSAFATFAVIFTDSAVVICALGFPSNLEDFTMHITVQRGYIANPIVSELPSRLYNYGGYHP